jgi:SagB-type dehydrogenase family enzyme
VPAAPQNASSGKNTVIKLPEPRQDSDVSLEQSLLERRSVRSYQEAPLTLEEVSQLLWAAQGVTDAQGYRTAPSAGALYPLETYLVAGNVEGLEAGVYRYVPDGHELSLHLAGDHRNELYRAALSQTSVSSGAVSIVFTAVYERTTGKYGERGIRYVHLESGHAAQNLCLQVAALDLGAVVIGAFNDGEVAAVLDLPGDEMPLYIVPVGRR